MYSEKKHQIILSTSDQVELFDAIINSTNKAIVGINQDGYIVYFNRGSEKLFGYKKDALFGEPAQVIFPITENHSQENLFISQIESLADKSIENEFVAQRKDGTQIIVNVSVSAKKLSNFELFTLMIGDVSEQKKAEDHVYQLYVLMKQMGNMAKVGAWSLDIETEAVMMTDSLYEIFELDPNVPIDLEAGLSFYTDEAKAILQHSIDRAIKHGENYRHILQVVTRNGTEKWVETLGEPVEKNGKVVKLQGSLQEITQYVEAEKMIKQQKEQAEFVAKVASRLNSELTLPSVFTAICEEISKGLKTDIVSVSLFDPVTDQFSNVKTIGLSVENPGDLFEWSRDQVEVLSKECHYGIIQTKVDPDSLPEETFIRFQMLGIRKAATALMYYRDKLIGAVHLIYKNADYQLTGSELNLLRLLADQSAPAIVNAQLYAHAKEQISNIEALRNIDSVIANSFDVRFTLKTVIDVVLSQLKVDAADVLLYKPLSNTMEYAAGKGFLTSTMQKGKLRLGEGISGRAARERRRIFIPDLSSAKQEFSRMHLYENENFASFMVIPLIAKGQIKGVLEVFHRTPLKFDENWLNYFETVAGQAAIAIDSSQSFEELQIANLDLSLAYDNTIEGWSHAMDLRDKETEGHTQRVTEMTMRMAEAYGMQEEEMVHVRRGALLHDIGKLGVPDHILLKAGKLTDDEWVLMRQHTQFAYDMLFPIKYLRPAMDIPYCHHEKWDGSGYPRGLKGEEIPVVARLFAVVDVWDALSSDRPYRKGWPKEKVYDYLREQSGSHFDPKAIEIFFQVLDEMNF